MDTKDIKDISIKTLLNNICALIPVGIFWKDKERRFIGANQMFLDYYGLQSVQEIIGKTDEDMGWHINPEPFKNIEKKVLEEGEVISDIAGQCIVQGSLRKIRASKCPMVENGEIIGLVGYFLDVTEQEQEIERLAELSKIDELTGLLNRRAFNEIVKEYEEQYRQEKTDFVLFRMDIDKFKAFNDDYGYEFGDVVLKDVCQSLKRAAGESSIVFRVNGDEFIILHQYKNKDDTEALAKRFVNAIETPRNIDGVKPNLKVSIGHAYYSETRFIESLLNDAEKKMYEHKNNK